MVFGREFSSLSYTLLIGLFIFIFVGKIPSFVFIFQGRALAFLFVLSLVALEAIGRPSQIFNFISEIKFM